MVLQELYDLNGIGLAKAESLISGLKAYPPPLLVFLPPLFLPAFISGGGANDDDGID